jgi:T-complex protein 1 subunit eta
MKKLDIVHPAAKTLVDIARAQDAEVGVVIKNRGYLINEYSKVGDGTTSVVLFTGELLKEVRPFIEDGVPPQTVIKGFRTASELVCWHFGYF